MCLDVLPDFCGWNIFTKEKSLQLLGRDRFAVPYPFTNSIVDRPRSHGGTLHAADRIRPARLVRGS